MYIAHASDSYLQQRILSNLFSTLTPNEATSLHLSTHISIPNKRYAPESDDISTSSSSSTEKRLRNFFREDDRMQRKEKLKNGAKGKVSRGDRRPRQGSSTSASKKNPNSNSNSKKNNKNSPKPLKIPQQIELMVQEEMEKILREKRVSDEEREENDMTPLEIRVEEEHKPRKSRTSASSRRSKSGPQLSTSGVYFSHKRTEPGRHEQQYYNQEAGNMMESDAEAASMRQYDPIPPPPKQRLKSSGRIFSSEPKYGRPNMRNTKPKNTRNGDKKEMKKVLLNQFELTNVLHDQLSELKRKKKSGMF